MEKGGKRAQEEEGRRNLRVEWKRIGRRTEERGGERRRGGEDIE